MAYGQEKPAEQPELRAAAPHQGGPLGSSGAAPGSTGAHPITTDLSGGEISSAGYAAEPPEAAADQGEHAAEPAYEPTERAGATEQTGGVSSHYRDDPEHSESSSDSAGETPQVPGRTPNALTKTSMTDISDESEKSDLSVARADGREPAGAASGEVLPADKTSRGETLMGTGSSDGDPTGKSSNDETPTGTGSGGGDAAGKESGGGESAGTASGGAGTGGEGGGAAAGPARRLRRASPIRVVRHAGRSTSAWAKRPSGRLILPAIVAILLVGAAGTAGAYLVPEALKAASPPSGSPGFPIDATNGSAPAGAGLATGSAPAGANGFPPASAPAFPAAQNGARPADALAGWAEQIGTKVGIPVVAVEAYGYAELVVARTTPTCHLSWTTLAAIGKVESGHGSYNGSVLGADGTVQPPIYGLPLDGKGGRALVRDTDQGTIDGDTTYDRAVGPMQFIPSTWLTYKVDADNNGVADPNDIDDASLAAANYLCQGGRDLSKADSWWDAILSYNALRPYAQNVFDAANDYGQRSRA